MLIPDRASGRNIAMQRSSWGNRALHLFLLTAAVLVAFRASSLASDNKPYLLWAQDKIRVTISEWRPSRDEFFEWKAINGEYSVQPNGILSIPLIGEVQAAGLSTGVLSRKIGTMLQERTGLAQNPDVAIEIVQFRPVYITGHVERPGEFAFRPNLMVLQAVALSGGARRPPVGSRVERDIISGRSELKHLAADYSGLLARKARFEAEIADEAQIKFPIELTERRDDGPVVVLMQQERALFEARRTANLNQIRMLNDLRQYLETEVSSIQSQLGTHNHQIELVTKELDNVRMLVTKGLAVEPRRLGLERNVAQLEGDRLRLESNMSRARQEISRTGLSILEFTTKREIEAATGLRDTQAKIEEVMRRFETSKGLLNEAETTATVSFDDVSTSRAKLVYTIIRQNAAGIATEIIAADTTLVQPGDTIKVELPVDEKSMNRVLNIRRQGKQPS